MINSVEPITPSGDHPRSPKWFSVELVGSGYEETATPQVELGPAVSGHGVGLLSAGTVPCDTSEATAERWAKRGHALVSVLTTPSVTGYPSREPVIKLDRERLSSGQAKW